MSKRAQRCSSTVRSQSRLSLPSTKNLSDLTANTPGKSINRWIRSDKRKESRRAAAASSSAAMKPWSSNRPSKI